MVSIEEAVIARLRRGDRVFEILIDCERALALRRGESVDIRDVLAVEEIFKDARKGERASGLLETFGTQDKLGIAREIIKSGEIQLTADYRRKLQEEKKRRIISLISTNAIDPRTGKPIPPQRVELALKEAKCIVDPFKPAEEQVKDIVKELRAVLPLSFEERELRIVIPPAYAGKAYGMIIKLGEVKRDEWLADGSWLCILRIPAGIQEEVIDKVNKLTHGEGKISLG
jgi:ribosome maturation protein SDO1